MERFVVGTGRCGSTLLSTMLAEHPAVVSIHEFFTGLDWGQRFAPGLITGAELADLIGAEQPVTTAVLARGHRTDEIRYPFGSPQARFAPGEPVPWLLVTMISRLTDDPHLLFDGLIAEAHRRPPASLADHYRSLFDWLASRCGRGLWIERSGSSIDYLGDLAALYPDARFVHIHRDGREAALSIRDHPFFRLGVSIFMDLFPAGDDEDAVITEVIETPPPCWAVGRYWSDQVLRGFAALPQLDADQFLQVRFEDLVTEPVATMDAIAAFFELPFDADFVDRAASLVRGLPPLRFDDLSVAEQDELTEACRPGQLLLRRVD